MQRKFYRLGQKQQVVEKAAREAEAIQKQQMEDEEARQKAASETAQQEADAQRQGQRRQKSNDAVDYKRRGNVKQMKKPLNELSKNFRSYWTKPMKVCRHGRMPDPRDRSSAPDSECRTTTRKHLRHENSHP